jgi:hypothetical protein
MKDKANEIGQGFKGKVILLYLIHSSDDYSRGIVISDPVLGERYGRAFVVGVVPQSQNDWSSGQAIGVALDQIAHFLEFDNEQEYMDKVALASQNKALNIPC